MATGLKVLRAISDKRRGWPPNAEFKICAVDAVSLLSLSMRDLLRERFRDTVAAEVVTALRNGDITLLGRRLGLRFVHSDEVTPLVAERPKARKAKRLKSRGIRKKPAKRKKSVRAANSKRPRSRKKK